MGDAKNSAEKRSRLLRGFLIVSLALNLAVVGVVAGSALSGRWGNGPRGFDFAVGPMAAALSKEDRDAIRDRLRHGRDRQPPRKDGIMRVAGVLDALRSEPYDPAILADFFSQLQRRTSSLQKEAQEALIIQVQAMSMEEREAFAARLEVEMSRPQPRR